MPIKGQVLKPWPDANGYPTVYLTNRQAVNVHRLAAIAFLGDGGELHVNHIDGDKTNNRAENLEWMTRVENMAHAIETGLLTLDRSVIATPKGGGPPIMFKSIKEAAAFVGSKRATNIGSVANGRRPYAYGHSWEYASAA